LVRDPDHRFQSTVNWAIAYLRGRAGAYTRGSVTIKNLNGAVRLALSRGASVSDVRYVLHRYLLDWDEEKQTVVTR
jgi:hypothetical protein